MKADKRISHSKGHENKHIQLWPRAFNDSRVKKEKNERKILIQQPN